MIVNLAGFGAGGILQVAFVSAGEVSALPVDVVIDRFPVFGAVAVRARSWIDS